jgi:hypothetical protein
LKLNRFIFIILLLSLMGCAASYQQIKKNTVHLNSYGKLTLTNVSATEFWNKNSSLKEDAKWTSEVDRANEHLTKGLTKYFSSEWKGTRDKELAVEAELFEFDPGSRAARYVVGFGAGKGKIGYHIVLTDAATSETMSSFDAYGTLSMGVFGGDISTAYDQCVKAVIAYLNDNK